MHILLGSRSHGQPRQLAGMRLMSRPIPVCMPAVGMDGWAKGAAIALLVCSQTLNCTTPCVTCAQSS